MTKNSKMNASFCFVPMKTTSGHARENKEIYIIILPQMQKQEKRNGFVQP